MNWNASKYSVFLILLVFSLIAGCSTRYSISRIDPTYAGVERPPLSRSIYITIPADKRQNPKNVPNFERTWGYSTDRGMFNVIFSSENTLASIVFDIMKGACNAMGYAVILLEDKGQIDPANPANLLMTATINDLWSDGKCYGTGSIDVKTSMAIDFQLINTNTAAVLNRFAINQNTSKRLMVVSMKGARNKTEKHFADEIEQLKADIMSKFEGVFAELKQQRK